MHLEEKRGANGLCGEGGRAHSVRRFGLTVAVQPHRNRGSPAHGARRSDGTRRPVKTQHVPAAKRGDKGESVQDRGGEQLT